MQCVHEIQWEDILKKTIDGWSCVAAIIFVEKGNVITQSGAAAQRNLTNECNMSMKCNRGYFKRNGWSCIAAIILVAKER